MRYPSDLLILSDMAHHRFDHDMHVLYSFKCRNGRGWRPSRPAKPTNTTERRQGMRITTCTDCGEEIEIDSDGFRTLCGCDVAE